MQSTGSIFRIMKTRAYQDVLEPGRAKPRRVALFTGAYNHIADGVTLTLNRLVEHLESIGDEVLVFSPTNENPLIKHKGTLVPVPSLMAPGRPEYLLSTGFPAEARKRLREFRPTLFHIATPDFLGFRALRLAKSWNMPVVTSFHTHFSSYLKYYKLGAIEDPLWMLARWFYGRCDQIYVPSMSIARMLRKRGVETDVRLWPRGVDSSFFNPGKRSMEWRRSIGISDNEIIVTFVSRLVWEKGLGVFADVIESLSRDGIPHRSVIVGDGPARSVLEQRLPGTVFVGFKRGEELATAYASSDIFLFPSDTETFGNVTLEAMASGLPTVCADASGSDALVSSGKTGYLVPPGESHEFTERMRELVLNEDLRNAYSYAATEAAIEYHWPSILARLVGYYDELVGRVTLANGEPRIPYESSALHS